MITPMTYTLKSGLYGATVHGPLYLSMGNRKLQATGKLLAELQPTLQVEGLQGTPMSLQGRRRSYRIASFNLPAYKSKTGRVVCPMAGICANFCYARERSFMWPIPRQVREDNLATLLAMRAAGLTAPEIGAYLADLVEESGVDGVRLHDSGDFFTRWYLDAWAAAIDLLRLRGWNGRIYWYTKAVSFMAGRTFGDGVAITLSEGGKQDALIDLDVQAHSRIFTSFGALHDAGYTDGTETTKDLPALMGVHRIGLCFHGDTPIDTVAALLAA